MSGMLIDDDSMAIIIARLRSDMSVTNWYGESTTAAATTQKEVSIPSITTLNTGQVIVVKPTITSTVANSTLKLNNFDAYPMRYNNADITTSSDSIVWNANYPSQFLFNGSYWVFLGHGIDSNTTYSAMSVAEGTAGTATSSRTMRADYLKQIIEALVPLAETDPIFTASAAHGIQATDITAWNGKQDALVSGTNIKTINNESILGSGNISIGGGGTATDVKINGTSITISNEADIITEGTYDATTNKIATMSEIPTNVSDLNNDSGFITTETDPTVPSWAKASSKPSYNFSEIGNTPTTLSGYGITDANITSGTITLGSDTITPITSETQLSKGTTTGAGNAVTDLSVSGHQITLTKGKTFLESETDPIFTASAAYGISSSDITNWNAKYDKPSTGIPSTDLASAVQTSLGKADTALQSETYTGTITGITMNGASKGTSGVVDLGTVITSETQLSKGTTTGNGNAVTDISVSGHQITLTKGTTFLTSFTEADPIFSASAASGITSTNISNWNTASTNSHSHSNKSTLDGISSSDVSNWNGKQSPQTTLSGYGITDAKIQNGTITLGSNTITPITSHQDISGKVDLSGGQMQGELTAYSQDSPNNAQVRNIHISTSEPTSADGNDGDIWIVYNI